MGKNKQLSEHEKENNQALIEMHKYVNAAGFKGNVTVSDKGETLFEGTGIKIELLVGRGIELHLKGKNLKSYQKLDIHQMHYLKEAEMEIYSYRKEENPGFSIRKELHIDLLESGLTIKIEPTE